MPPVLQGLSALLGECHKKLSSFGKAALLSKGAAEY